MAVYVDELQWYPGNGQRFGGRGKWWCHLITDGEIQELHDFAQKIGLKREWFQGLPRHNYQHYDLTESMQKTAILTGARLVTSVELVKILKNKKVSL